MSDNESEPETRIPEPVIYKENEIRVKNLDFTMPRDYPYLERVIGIFLPMHFTYTQVDPVQEPGTFWYEGYRKIDDKLKQLCCTFQPPIDCFPVYGRVRNDRTPISGQIIMDVTSPKLLAFHFEPRDMGRWREVEAAVQEILDEGFPNGRPPVRYYYGSVLVHDL